MNRLTMILKISKLRFFFMMLFCYELAFSAWAPASTNQYQLSEKSKIKIAQIRVGNSLARQLTANEKGAPAPKNISDLKGFNELVPFVSPSPDQEDAGTCLFMSLTGIAEWFLNKKNGSTFKQNGIYDLSERWWVNMNSRLQSEGKIDQWMTDTIYLFNRFSGVLNSSYPFTKGWFQLSNSVITKAQETSAGARFGTTYNWLDETASTRLAMVKLPHFQRIVLFHDQNPSPWNFGEANFQVVELVKKSLQTYKAPVQVIYNHLGYWHSVFILGYDDNLPTYNCYFIRETREFYQQEIAKTEILLKQTNDLELSGELQSKLNMLKSNSVKFGSVHKKNGGCRQQGMFYVRDSQYSDSSEEMYHYDLSHLQYSKPYSKKIILREYNWLSDLANNVIQITTNPEM